MGDALQAVASLGRVLLSTTLLQALGYCMKRAHLFPSSAEPGIGAFIGGISLPMIIFRAVAAVDFLNVDTSILVAAVVGKLIMIAASFVLGRVALRGTVVPPGERELRGGMFAVLTTNGDELGLGLPVMGAIFDNEMVAFLFLLNGLQMMVMNVLCFVLLGVGATKRDAAKAHEPAESTGAIVLSVIGGLWRNRLMQSLALAVLYNAIFGRLRGTELPFFLDDIATLLAGAFAPGVFFLAGTSSVGAFAQLGSLDSAWLPLALVSLKSLILPAIVKTLVGALGGTELAQDFGFVFGMLPAAGSSLVFVNAYAPSRPQELLLSATLALGRIIGFPLLLLAAAILMVNERAQVLVLEQGLSYYAQALSFALTLYLFVSVVWCRQWLGQPLRQIYLLVAFELLVMGLSLWQEDTVAHPHHLSAYDQAMLLALGMLRWAKEAALTMIAAGEADRLKLKTKQRHARRRSTLLCGQRNTSGSLIPGRLSAIEREPSETGMMDSGPRSMTRRCSVTGVSLHDVAMHAADGVEVEPSFKRLERRSTREASSLVRRFHKPADALVVTQTVHRRNKMQLPPISGREWAALGVMAAVAAVMTLPWAVMSTWTQPGTYQIYKGLHASQTLAFAVAYLMLTAVLVVSLVPIVRNDTRCTQDDKRAPVGQISSHAFSLRIEIMVIMSVTRLLSSAAISLAAFASAKPTGSIAHILLVTAALANSQGVLLFCLFGLTPMVLTTPARRLRKVWRAAQRCFDVLTQHCQPGEDLRGKDGEGTNERLDEDSSADLPITRRRLFDEQPGRGVAETSSTPSTMPVPTPDDAQENPLRRARAERRSVRTSLLSARNAAAASGSMTHMYMHQSNATTHRGKDDHRDGDATAHAGRLAPITRWSRSGSTWQRTPSDEEASPDSVALQDAPDRLSRGGGRVPGQTNAQGYERLT